MSRGVVDVPVLMQMQAAECGAVCLRMVCAYYGKWVLPEKAREDCGVSRDGSRASSLVKAARLYGLKAKGYRGEIEDLKTEVTYPCILHWGFNHFVVLKGFKAGYACINDPAKGDLMVSMQELDESFTGILMCFEPGENFVADGKPPNMRAYMLSRIKGVKIGIYSAAIVTALIAILNMTRPLFAQTFLNQVLPGDSSGVTAAFFLLLVLICIAQVALASFSSLYLIRVEGGLASRTVPDYMWKVLHLPISFFGQRNVGDIVSRGRMNANIAQTTVTQIAPLLITGLSMLAYLIIMFLYSPALALIGLGAAVLKLISVRFVAQRRANALRVQMKDESLLANATINGISMVETIKAAGAEQGYFQRWAGYQAGASNQGVRFSKVSNYLGLIPQSVSALADAFVLLGGVYLVMTGHFDIGMVVALQGYFSQFMAPVDSLSDAMENLEQMLAQAERVNDVLAQKDDPLVAQTPVEELDGLQKLKGAIKMEHVSFGYSPLEPPLISDFNLELAPGDSVAFVGPSGCGKSTLAKLISGLYIPWEGRILLDGTPLEQVPRAVRSGSIAVIDQNILLFDDTISNNISLWDKSIQDYEIILAARDAQVHDAIMARPGGYEYVLAEGGKDFSGGQCQRIEIARALAADPTVLIMDEATSALDSKTEDDVLKAVRRRGITTVTVAHRLSAIRDCQRIIVMDKGRVVQQGSHEELMADKDGLYVRLVAQE